MDIFIEKIEGFYYKIPFSFPISPFRTYLREGLIICVYDKDGNTGVGEISPLEGLSREKLRDCIKELKKSSNISKLELPSIRFGLELSILILMLRKGLIKPRKEKVRVNALITRDNIHEVEDLIKKGYSSFKIKVREMEDWSLVKEVRDIVGDNMEIRVDSNSRFSLDMGVEFGKKISPFNINYIEDPIENPYLFKEFFLRTGIKVGIDKDLDKKDVRYGKHVKAWIIKPGIHGGISDCIDIIADAMRNGIQPILSNPFYSGVGTGGIAILSSIMGLESAMGLDPYRWIEEDILKDRFSIEGGEIKIRDVIEKIIELDKERLIGFFRWRRGWKGG